MQYRVRLTLEDGSCISLLNGEGGDLLTAAELEPLQPLITAVREGTTRIGYNREFGGLSTAAAWELGLGYDPEELVQATAVEVETVEAELQEVASSRA